MIRWNDNGGLWSALVGLQSRRRARAEPERPSFIGASPSAWVWPRVWPRARHRGAGRRLNSEENIVMQSQTVAMTCALCGRSSSMEMSQFQRPVPPKLPGPSVHSDHPASGHSSCGRPFLAGGQAGGAGTNEGRPRGTSRKERRRKRRQRKWRNGNSPAGSCKLE